MTDQFPRRSKTALPQHLVEGWPVDYQGHYVHPTNNAQLEVALREPMLRLNRWMAGDMPDWAGMIFYGEPGFGKTSVCLALAHCAAIHGFHSRFITAERIAAKRASTTFNWKDGQTEEGLLEELLAPDLLVFDDIAAREYSAPARAMFLDVIRERKSLGRINILNTNLKLGALKTGTPEEQKKDEIEAAQGRMQFSAALDARILSSFSGQAFNAGKWVPEGKKKAISLRGR